MELLAMQMKQVCPVVWAAEQANLWLPIGLWFGLVACVV